VLGADCIGDNMTVQELIDELNKHPSNARVMVSGYEGGVQDPSEVAYIPVWKNNSGRHWQGTHDTEAPLNDENRPPDEWVVWI